MKSLLGAFALTLLAFYVGKPQVPPQIPVGTVVFPPDAGILNVKSYGAKGDGATDDTAAIRNAIRDTYNKYNSQNIRYGFLYFPDGTYLVSDTLDWKDSGSAWHGYLEFRGQGQTSSIIKLKNSTPGFGNPSAPKAVVYMASEQVDGQRTDGGGDEAFRVGLFDMTVDTGTGNPGAIGVNWIGNNQSALRRVTIRSGDGKGVAGLEVTRPYQGPELFRNLTVIGFDYGIRCGFPLSSAVFEHIVLQNQNVYGIANFENVMSIRDLTSTNTVPAILNDRFPASLILIDAKLNGGAGGPAIISSNNAKMYLRNVTTTGYANVGDNNGAAVPSPVTEYISSPVSSLFPSPGSSLNLPIQEAPDFEDTNLGNWANVQNYGAVPGNNSDDGVAIQAAIDSGKSTIYFPPGAYLINDSVHVRGAVKRIVGYGAQLSPVNPSCPAATGHPALIFDGNSTVILEDVTFVANYQVAGFPEFSFPMLQHSGPQTVVLRNLMSVHYRSLAGAGPAFVENVCCGPFEFNKNTVWARQLDPELTGTHVTNNGSTLWVLGLKTEGKGTIVSTAGGGRTELLGAYVSLQILGGTPTFPGPGFVNDESSHSLIYATDTDHNFDTSVRETRGGITKTMTPQGMPMRYKGTNVPLYAGYAQSIPPPGTIYVSDLTWTSVANGWGPVEKDRSNGEQAPGDGGPITIGGVAHAKGLGTHATSDVHYNIGRTCSAFNAIVGIDGEILSAQQSQSSVVFQVWGDGVKLYDSGVVRFSTPPVNVAVDITNKSDLELVVTDAGDGNASDHADWAEARVTCPSGGGGDTTPPTVPTVSPASGAIEVATSTTVRASFSEAMNAGTINTSTFTLVLQGTSTAIPATVTYDATSFTATLTPSAALQLGTVYTATVKSGASGVKDTSNNALAADKVWSFTTSTPVVTTKFVSDLTWTSMTNGWGPAEKDKSNGEQAAGDGRTISIRGKTYAKGLGVHAPSNIVYNLAAAGSCTRFTSDVGVDDESNGGGSVGFQVLVDGVKLFDSGVITGKSAVQTASVDITGKNQLTLILNDGADGTDNDHADWAGAQLTCLSGTDTTPPTVASVSPTNGVTGVATSTTVKATFSEAINAATLTTATFTLAAQGTPTPVAATVTYDATSFTATLTPSAALQPGKVYTATVKGGAGGVKDTSNNALASDMVWTFSTNVTIKFLSDLTWSSMTNGWGPAEKDMSNGDQGAGDGRTISIRGKTYPKGLGVHAVSNIVYNLATAGTCTSFTSDVGIDDEVTGGGSVVFQVVVDGVTLFDSGVVTRTSAVKTATVDVTGKSQLTLKVNDGGDGVTSDHSDWAGAQLMCH